MKIEHMKDFFMAEINL